MQLWQPPHISRLPGHAQRISTNLVSQIMQPSVHSAHKLFRDKNYSQALAAYRSIQQAYPEIRAAFDANIKLCRTLVAKTNSTGCIHHPEIDITLTTISGRVHLIKAVLESLHNQTLKPARIILNISADAYLLDEGLTPDDPHLKELGDFPLLELNWTRNTGPYRKILPYMEKFFNEPRAEHRLFVTVDDDTLYPPHFLQDLYDSHIQFGCVVAFRGRRITTDDQQLHGYKHWKLGVPTPDAANLPTGKDGIMYSTRFFHQDFLDYATASRLAPTADDLWIKWHCALNGVPAVILNPEAATSDYKSFPVVDYSPVYRDSSLYKMHNSDSSGAKNDKSVAELEKYFKQSYGYNLGSTLPRGFEV